MFTTDTYEAARHLCHILENGRMLVVRALVWRHQGSEQSQVEVVKLHSSHDLHRTLSRFSFSTFIDFGRNTLNPTQHSFEISSNTTLDMIRHLEAIMTAWDKKEDLLLGRNERKELSPWIAADTPYFGNIFQGPDFRRSVPASHPDILPMLAMCASRMSSAFQGMDQHFVESELLAHFNSFVVQARREAIRNLYGSH